MTAKISQRIIKKEKIPSVISERENSSQDMEIQVQSIQTLRRKDELRKGFKMKNGIATNRFQRKKVNEKMSRGNWKKTQEWRTRWLNRKHEGIVKERPQKRRR